MVLIMYILEYNSTYLSSYLLPRYLVAMATLLLEILPIALVDKKEREKEAEKEKETEKKKIANQTYVSQTVCSRLFRYVYRISSLL